ncbi:hypothetical protein ALO43_200123 [Pseudomonas tremae]|uniref:Nicotinamide riboside transporter PnuC n=2 Tax=Pseudomonas tremae TaxID=200454 RepID=A0AA40TVS0_9PSED|nr:hypothetical protein ALO43_200123 [Pseudomonas tremae]
MAHKRVQCWPLWIVLDVIFVGLFIYKELYLTAALYALFTLLAVQGWREWYPPSPAGPEQWPGCRRSGYRAPVDR